MPNLDCLELAASSLFPSGIMHSTLREFRTLTETWNVLCMGKEMVDLPRLLHVVFLRDTCVRRDVVGTLRLLFDRKSMPLVKSLSLPKYLNLAPNAVTEMMQWRDELLHRGVNRLSVQDPNRLRIAFMATNVTAWHMVRSFEVDLGFAKRLSWPLDVDLSQVLVALQMGVQRETFWIGVFVNATFVFS
ncbi:hypothetical protein GGF32_000592 [Allomyces javanicus]|nr:hypothetical protein GGF32_000592 [Allomyces javanicus]